MPFRRRLPDLLAPPGVAGPVRTAALLLLTALWLAPWHVPSLAHETASPASTARADAGKPKLGPDAVLVQQAPDYLRTHAAPDFWALMPHYASQTTSSSCSVASLTMLVNALRGVPPYAKDALVTQSALLEAAGIEKWTRDAAEGGAGVSFAEFETYARRSLQAYGLEPAGVDVFRPGDGGPAALEGLRRLLAENERNARDIVVVYFNQGVLTGDWDGPHISPIGAYDAERRRVLVMDVDREWYVPYWSSDEKLLEAMRRPWPGRPEPGGLIRVRLGPADR